ncbi:hypothetical protein GCM10011579_041510 [Streptomyces albiflavescens]|uniref:Uncharacterized protein n=1 Tax=Streptomyces albiflavescens TaxID=1623582 RepID=A0A918D5G1_9ACTN|nr:hypothetical protein GCM10011579_041510 [Streptomyces albiflavescens]
MPSLAGCCWNGALGGLVLVPADGVDGVDMGCSLSRVPSGCVRAARTARRITGDCLRLVLGKIRRESPVGKEYLNGAGQADAGGCAAEL